MCRKVCENEDCEKVPGVINMVELSNCGFCRFERFRRDGNACFAQGQPDASNIFGVPPEIQPLPLQDHCWFSGAVILPWEAGQSRSLDHLDHATLQHVDAKDHKRLADNMKQQFAAVHWNTKTLKITSSSWHKTQWLRLHQVDLLSSRFGENKTDWSLRCRCFFPTRALCLYAGSCIFGRNEATPTNQIIFEFKIIYIENNTWVFQK